MSSASHWYLLIGTDFYQPGKALDSEGKSYIIHNLRGCVSDIEQVERYLTSTLRVPASQIEKLTSRIPLLPNITKPEEPMEPAEPESKRSTKSNILSKLNALREKAGPGDVIFIHYSGHGARTRTLWPELKGSESAYDEALVPCDARVRGEFVRDVELGWQLHCMAKKKLFVTIVLDCCHSGGATRDDDDDKEGVARCVESDYNGVGTRELAGASPVMLASLMRPGDKTEAETEMSWLQRSGQYELLAACQANQKAREKENNGRFQGALTRFLMEALAVGGPLPTHGMLFRRIAGAMRSDQLQQTPVFSGNKKRGFLSPQNGVDIPTIAITTNNFYGVLYIEIQAGSVHGVVKDSEFLVHSWNTTELVEANAVAKLKVIKIHPLKSTVKFAEVEYYPERIDKIQILNGYRAVQYKLPISRQVKVRFHDSLLANGSLHRALATSSNTRCLAALSKDANELVNYVIAVDDQQKLVLRNGTNQPIPNFPSSSDPATLLERLTRLVRHSMLLDLADVPTSISATPPETLSFNFGLADSRAPDSAGNIPFFHDEKLLFKFENTSVRTLHLVVLNLRPLYGIRQVYPKRNSYSSGLIEPGESHPDPPFHSRIMKVPTAVERPIVDIFKAFVTTEQVEFGFMEQDNIDPSTGSEKVDETRGGGLETFFELFDETYRGSGSGGALWATAEIRVCTRRKVTGKS